MLQKQKDTTLAMLGPGAPVPPPAGGMLQEPSLERMGRELVTLCDQMERHGLVDYQMGVWEEEIMNGEFTLLFLALFGFVLQSHTCFPPVLVCVRAMWVVRAVEHEPRADVRLELR